MMNNNAAKIERNQVLKLKLKINNTINTNMSDKYRKREIIGVEQAG